MAETANVDLIFKKSYDGHIYEERLKVKQERQTNTQDLN